MHDFTRDPVLRLLPDADDLPTAFRQMPYGEQRWRARLYLAAWVMTDGFGPMAWAYALAEEATGVDRGRGFVKTIDVEHLISEVQRLIAEGKRP